MTIPSGTIKNWKESLQKKNVSANFQITENKNTDVLNVLWFAMVYKKQFLETSHVIDLSQLLSLN